ncbi:DNA modification methylase [Olavius algarvensis spirochete endosymbiont]|uniref:DNA-methyltransferase n=1 Tax=Olavius algarvensis spirochete endosymbiont TaxID=260710 RepID=UPI000F0D7759|nr:site-specific DNA-methyltransferase [Olavius algarvensis spirochete endosymbiont]VDA99907.1 DNA modification methylase [Olavius algarvensis spirochete endosymbiont]
MVHKAELIGPIDAPFDEVVCALVGSQKKYVNKAEAKPIESGLKRWLNKIHQMDCIDLMKKLPPKSVSVVVTSPPYNLKNSTGNGMKDGRGGKWANAALIDGYASCDDNKPYDEYVAWQRDCLTKMMRVLKDDGAIFYNHKWRVQRGLLQDRQDIVSGFPVRQIIIWRRKGGINFNAGYFLPTYEVIYLIANPDFKLAPKANAQGDVWEIPQARNIDHPAPFPVELAQRCISSTISGVVFDPFMGSGSTAIAAEILDRQWIGAEISKEYCRTAKKRLVALENTRPIK